MTNKIIAIQGNNPSQLNPKTDTTIFLANEIQNKNYKLFYFTPKNLSIINKKVNIKCLPISTRWYEFDDIDDLKNF